MAFIFPLLDCSTVFPEPDPYHIKEYLHHAIFLAIHLETKSFTQYNPAISHMLSGDQETSVGLQTLGGGAADTSTLSKGLNWRTLRARFGSLLETEPGAIGFIRHGLTLLPTSPFGRPFPKTFLRLMIGSSSTGRIMCCY
jgi:hypothetical protein